VSAAVSQHENNAGPRLIADGILRMLFIAGGGMLEKACAPRDCPLMRPGALVRVQQGSGPCHGNLFKFFV
jgi:hypothetical protein